MMAFSDARNERDRADTGRNSSNHGGRDNAGAERRNREAMAANNRPTNAAFGGGPAFQPRRTQNVTPSYDMTPMNMAKMGMMMGGTVLGGSPLTAMGMMGRPLGAAMGPAIAGLTGFDGYRGNVNGPGDYDGPNRFATNGSSLFPNPQQGVQGIQAAGIPKPPMAQPQQGMGPLQMPAAQLNVPGPSQYGVNLPQYGYFGKPPALQRPKSTIMGGI